MRGGAVASLVASLITLLLVLSGCAGKPASQTSAASTASEPAAPAPAFSVAAPDFRTGYGWVQSFTAAGKASAQGFQFPIEESHSAGMLVLSSGYSISGAAALVGVGLGGAEGVQATSQLVPVGAFALVTDQAGRVRVHDLGNVEWLRACQTEPAACPTDLAGKTSGFATFGDLRFPLQPGLAWDSTDAPEGFSGSFHASVAGVRPSRVLDRDVQVVRLNDTGSYRVSDQDGDVRVTGTVTMDGTIDYSQDFLIQSGQEQHQVSKLDLTKDGQRIHLDMDQTNRIALVGAELAEKPSLDPVELYDAFGFGGRAIDVEVQPAGDGKVDIALGPVETPAGEVSWTLTDAQGKEVQHGSQLSFQATLGAGTYALHAEGRHKGVLLVEADAEVSAQGVQKKGPEGLDLKGTVTCDVVVFNLVPGGESGACPEFDVPIDFPFFVLNVTALANATNPAVSGRLEILDPDGAVVASADAGEFGAAEYVAGELPAAGTWKARFVPQVALQATVFFHVTAF